MGLKCSVLGHAYGETTVERDREERGSEVVITIRELETCDRCGDTRVVTENKEVTTIEAPGSDPDVTAADAMEAMDAQADESGAGDAGGTADDAAPVPTGPSPDEVPAGEDDAEVMVDDAEGGAAASAEQSDDGSVTDDASIDDTPTDDDTTDSAETPAPDAVEDQGAEILDAEASADEDDAVDDELADPTIENDADVPGDSAEDEDAVILEDDPAASSPGTDESGGPSAAESTDAAESPDEAPTESAETLGGTTGADEPGPFDPPQDDDDDEDPLGEWPEETLRDEDDSWTPTDDLTGTVGDVDPDADVDRELSTNSAVTVPEGEFHCEECGYTTSVEASSLRAGDFCPECRTGTLVHRPEE